LTVLGNWPIRLIITVSMLILLYLLLQQLNLAGTSRLLSNGTGKEWGWLADFAAATGFRSRGVNWTPYLIMLAVVVPLVSFAATQPDFLQTYPKMKLLQFQAQPPPSGWQKIAFQLAYGSDFITIELFFRGFLVVLLARLIGPAAILPMAVFYCSIHFGKPLLECISSYFGGLLLGIFACYSGSIYGGIVVHLGLAWMMELAATIALYNKR
ncbi:CPBP family intramembrane glutamic endopeptidase, partial [Flavihumibacter sp. CACIAM 22H1]|uniref:CPBP family intramembrane glutamic endopeptidase n=1 Tax=Flavihumibacter sp. CACIAM 22H1 TaxID=1812911 RepID=UPI0025C1B077